MPDVTTILLLVGVGALFYFMLIRPQQKRAKEQREALSALKPGDRVMTISGIVGTIKYLGEKQSIIEISPGVEMTVVKGAISSQPVEDEFEYADGDAELVAADLGDQAEPESEAGSVDEAASVEEPSDAAPAAPEGDKPTADGDVATGEETK